MKYLIHLAVTGLVGWPALVCSYLLHAAKAWLEVGKLLYGRHEEAVIQKFTKSKT